MWRLLLATGRYREIRAWIDANDRVAQRFAEFHGFAYDCGPATRYSPDGRDMSLYLLQIGG